MSEHFFITKGWLTNLVKDGALEAVWHSIQADREAIRAEVTKEVTEELLKDHFKIGENILFTPFDDEVQGVVCAYDKDGLVTSWAPKSCRRPPKTRPMTREEMDRALINKLKSEDLGYRPSDSKVHAILSDLGVPTEVPV